MHDWETAQPYQSFGRRPERSAGEIVTGWGLMALAGSLLTLVLLVGTVQVASVGRRIAPSPHGPLSRFTGEGEALPLPQHDIQIQPGDSLWRLAREFAPGQDPRPWIARTCELSGLHGPDLVLRAGGWLTVEDWR
jgi:hypothetical protein